MNLSSWKCCRCHGTIHPRQHAHEPNTSKIADQVWAIATPDGPAHSACVKQPKPLRGRSQGNAFEEPNCRTFGGEDVVPPAYRPDFFEGGGLPHAPEPRNSRDGEDPPPIRGNESHARGPVGRPIVKDDHRVCPRCGELTPWPDGFYADKTKSSGFSSHCRLCIRATRQAKRKANPEAAELENARRRKARKRHEFRNAPWAFGDDE